MVLVTCFINTNVLSVKQILGLQSLTSITL